MAEFFSGDNDGMIKVWSRELVSSEEQELDCHDNMISALCFTPDGNKVISRALCDNTIRVWDVQSAHA